MPVTYQIDKARQLIRTRCTAEVTIEEVLAHFQTLANDPDCPDYLDVLLDLSQQTSIPQKENLEQVTKAIGRVSSRVQFGNCAIIARQDALYGMLRMFEVFAERYFHQTHVFRTVGEAEAWLAAQHPTASKAG